MALRNRPTSRTVYRSFRPVLSAAARYRDADTDRDFHEARHALGAACIRWWFNLDPALVVTVRLPVEVACPAWRRVADAAIALDDDSRHGSAPWWRLYAAGSWFAQRADFEVSPAAAPAAAEVAA